MERETEASPESFFVDSDQHRLGTVRRASVVVLAAAANLLGWAVGHLILRDDWANCDRFSDGCEAHMLAFPAFIALWVSIVIGALVVWVLAVVASRVRIVPAWFPKRLVLPLAIYVAVQGALSLAVGVLAPVLLVPGYLLGPPLAVLFTRTDRISEPLPAHASHIN